MLCSYLLNLYHFLLKHDSVTLHAKIITTGYQDELDKNMKIENKSTKAEDRPTCVMPVYFFKYFGK